MSLLAVGLAIILLAGAGALVGMRESLFRVLMLLGVAIGLVPAIGVLAGGPALQARFDAPPPLGPWVLGVDALSALFLVVILIVGAACAAYGLPYLASPSDGRRSRSARTIAVAHALFALLVVALAFVVLARAAMLFLIVWEVMAVTAYFLVIVDSHQSEVRRAGMIYLVATHAGTLALFGLFAWWGKNASDLSFASLSDAAPSLPAGGAAVLVLALVGFGIKAGIVPLHFWLPEAHAAAPSHVSALMSGVVIKMGVYGLLRVIALMGMVPAWWGWVLLLLGATSGVLGVVWALAQHDIKRLLAFHSVENIGIILLGIGLGSLGLAYDHPAVALLGFAGAALHTLNHSLFKSLLFLGAGSAIHATGTRDIERLGGVARTMPRTAATFLIASVAIVGLPPLNGFVSEWLVYRAMLRVGLVADASRVAVLSAVALALIGGLALACFAKVVGVVYLGVPRDRSAMATHESPADMTVPMLALAAACCAIGLVPAAVLLPTFRAAAAVMQHVAGASDNAPAFLTVLNSPSVAVTWFALGLGALIALTWFARRAARAEPTSFAPTWGCGYAPVTPRMQYSASSFAAPLIGAFAPVVGVAVHRGASGGAFSTHPSDPALDRAVRPLWHRLQSAADALRPIQRGRLSSYLLYIVAAVVALLLYLLFGGGPS